MYFLFVKLFWSVILALAFAAFAQEPVAMQESAAVDSVAQVSPAPAEKNIPLPRQSAYLGRGISFGIGAGLAMPTTDCDCMGIWQAQADFFYADWASAGLDVRYFGGDLDDEVMVMYQRYRLNMRMHKFWDNLDVFVEPVLGFENTSISEFRSQMRHHSSSTKKPFYSAIIPKDTTSESDAALEPDDEDDSESRSESCEKMFSLDGFSLGLGTGFGMNLSRYFGVTGSALVEYNFSRSVLLSLTPGVAFNFREIWPWAKKNLRSTWVSLEFGAQRYFNRGVDDWAFQGFLGVQLGI